MVKRALITGSSGFVGHHCLEYFLEHTDWEMVCTHSFRHKGSVLRLSESNLINERTTHILWDLNSPFDYPTENIIFGRTIDDRGKLQEKKINYIINIASDSAVERSTSDPTSCLNNNWHLMVNMLEFARKCPGLESFIHISTDEVYGEAGEQPHKEWDIMLPSNPYAASKAAQEALAIAYWRTYNLPIVIINCMNIIGERQDKEKFIPKIIENVCLGKEMPIYAESEHRIGSRVYLYAKNLADAILFVTKISPKRYSEYVQSGHTAGSRPDKYHVCGEREVNNLELAQMVARIVNKPLKYKLVPSESIRPGYDRRYALDGSKLRNLGWNPPYSFEESLERIVKWTINHPHWVV